MNQNIGTQLRGGLAERFESYRSTTGLSTSEIVRAALMAYLKSQGV